MDFSEDAVRVAVRIRPFVGKETVDEPPTCVERVPTEPQVRVIGAKGQWQNYSYDAVFGPESSQTDVYNHCVQPLVGDFVKGYNVCVLAYGQTGSGKTFTMGSDRDSSWDGDLCGVIPRVTHEIFRQIHDTADSDSIERELTVEFVEVYGETVQDLLGASVKELKVRELENGEVRTTGNAVKKATSFAGVMHQLRVGTEARVTASTMMNAKSSRSHAIFILSLTQKRVVKGSDAEDEDIEETICSRFYFVDLAGSERIKRTRAEGQRLQEGIYINQGLFVLGNVVSALGNTQAKNKATRHVPYRDHILTRLLQNCIGGNSRTLMIACVAPGAPDQHETSNTLQYANRARNIKNRPVVNVDKHARKIAKLQSEVERLNMLLQAQAGGDGSGAAAVYVSSTEVLQCLGYDSSAIAGIEEQLTAYPIREAQRQVVDHIKQALAEASATPTALSTQAMTEVIEDCHATVGKALRLKGGGSKELKAALLHLSDRLSTLESLAALNVEANGPSTPPRRRRGSGGAGVEDDIWSASPSIIAMDSPQLSPVAPPKAPERRRGGKGGAAAEEGEGDDERGSDGMEEEGGEEECGDAAAATAAEQEELFDQLRQLQTENQQLAAAVTDAEQRLEELSEEIARSEAEKLKLQREMEDVEQHAKKAGDAEHMRARLLKKLAAKEREISTLRSSQTRIELQKKEALERKKKIEALEKDLHQVKRARVGDMRRHKKEKQSLQAQSQQHERKATALQRENMKLKLELKKEKERQANKNHAFNQRYKDLLRRLRAAEKLQKATKPAEKQSFRAQPSSHSGSGGAAARDETAQLAQLTVQEVEALRLQIERRREARLAAASARRAWGAKDGKGGVGAKDHSSGSLGSRIPRLRHGCHGSNANSSNGSGATSPASIASSAASPSDRHGGFTFTSSVSPAADAAEAALQHRRRQQGDSPVGLRQQLERMIDHEVLTVQAEHAMLELLERHMVDWRRIEELEKEKRSLLAASEEPAAEVLQEVEKEIEEYFDGQRRRPQEGRADTAAAAAVAKEEGLVLLSSTRGVPDIDAEMADLRASLRETEECIVQLGTKPCFQDISSSDPDEEEEAGEEEGQTAGSAEKESPDRAVTTPERARAVSPAGSSYSQGSAGSRIVAKSTRKGLQQFARSLPEAQELLTTLFALAVDQRLEVEKEQKQRHKLMEDHRLLAQENEARGTQLLTLSRYAEEQEREAEAFVRSTGDSPEPMSRSQPLPLWKQNEGRIAPSLWQQQQQQSTAEAAASPPLPQPEGTKAVAAAAAPAPKTRPPPPPPPFSPPPPPPTALTRQTGAGTQRTSSSSSVPLSSVSLVDTARSDDSADGCIGTTTSSTAAVGDEELRQALFPVAEAKEPREEKEGSDGGGAKDEWLNPGMLQELRGKKSERTSGPSKAGPLSPRSVNVPDTTAVPTAGKTRLALAARKKASAPSTYASAGNGLVRRVGK